MMIENLMVDAAEMTHAWRVAGWATEVAARLGLSRCERETMERAAMLHHWPKVVVDQEALSALCRDLGIANSRRPEVCDDAVRLLEVMQGAAPTSERIKQLALILEQCDDLDSACELDARVGEDNDVNGLDGITEEIAGYLRVADEARLRQAAERLPVFPAVAHRALWMLQQREMEWERVEELISADATLAGHVVAAANSAAEAGVRAVSTIREALVRIGSAKAKRIVCASSLRSVFAKKHSHSLWNHCLDVAQMAVSIAGVGRRVEAGPAFLAGLVHDVGKLVILGLPGKGRPACQRLIDRGCPEVIVEKVIFGKGHTEIGRDVLRAWNFADEVVSAVGFHHEPERCGSALAGVLYLAEETVSRSGGIVSNWRHDLALKLAGVREVNPEKAWTRDRDLSGLRFAA
jgi:HD-like signal output (HDOD) protein